MPRRFGADPAPPRARYKTGAWRVAPDAPFYEGAFVTRNFALTASNLFLTGVAFDDLDGDLRYDLALAFMSSDRLSLPILAGLLLASVAAQASDAIAPGLFDIATETGTPQLEPGLSHAQRREQRCIDPRDAATLFPMLAERSLKGCRLEKADESHAAAGYDVLCAGAAVMRGAARWEREGSVFRGELNVTLGDGSAVYQRVVATRLGECPGGSD